MPLDAETRNYTAVPREHKTIDFMKHRWVCFILSLVVIVAGFVGMIGYGAAGKGALNFMSGI